MNSTRHHNLNCQQHAFCRPMRYVQVCQLCMPVALSRLRSGHARAMRSIQAVSSASSGFLLAL